MIRKWVPVLAAYSFLNVTGVKLAPLGLNSTKNNKKEADFL